jgi:hypothetical protein
MDRGTILRVTALLGFALCGRPLAFSQTPATQTPLAPPPPLTLAERTAIGMAQHDGPLTVWGLHKPVQVLRDDSGTVHIYAQDTHDLFFAQGFVAAQDHMWQMEMWRRSVEGKLAEVLGQDYVQRDKFARMLAFHGDWNAAFHAYHPEGELILQSFADGINAAIHIAVEEQKVPVEFSAAGFVPEPSWSAKTFLTQLPAWAMSPHSGLPQPVLDMAKGSSDLNWMIKPPAKPAAGEKPAPPTLISSPLPTGINPALAMMVDLHAPGWSAKGPSQAVLPGVAAPMSAIIGQPQVRVVEIGPALAPTSERQLIHAKPNPFAPVIFEIKRTANGPVLAEDSGKHQAYVLQWPEATGAAGLGALTPMQHKEDSVAGKAAAESAAKFHLLLSPEPEDDPKGADPNFERVQTELFHEESPISIAWGDYDNDGWPDMVVGYGRGRVKLFRHHRCEPGARRILGRLRRRRQSRPLHRFCIQCDHGQPALQGRRPRTLRRCRREDGHQRLGRITSGLLCRLQ